MNIVDTILFVRFVFNIFYEWSIELNSINYNYWEIMLFEWLTLNFF